MTVDGCMGGISGWCRRWARASRKPFPAPLFRTFPLALSPSRRWREGFAHVTHAGDEDRARDLGDDAFVGVQRHVRIGFGVAAEECGDAHRLPHRAHVELLVIGKLWHRAVPQLN